ncbi:MAG: hypothetical protein Q7V58_06965 [Actinomycetota bacterium]|nr:hypothetical protein [Actinomycetota bacterium]
MSLRRSSTWLTLVFVAAAAGAVVSTTTSAASPPMARDPAVDAWATKGLVVNITPSGAGFVGTVVKILDPQDGSAPGDTTCLRSVGDVVWKLTPTGVSMNPANGNRTYTYSGSVLPMRKPPAPATPPTPPAPPQPPTPPTPPAPPQPPAPPGRAGIPDKPKPPEPNPPPAPTPPPKPTPPPRPTPPTPPAAATSTCATWHDAHFSLFRDLKDGRLKIFDEVGGGNDEVIFWAQPY